MNKEMRINFCALKIKHNNIWQEQALGLNKAKFHLYGSFAQGNLEPNDIDIAIIIPSLSCVDSGFLAFLKNKKNLILSVGGYIDQHVVYCAMDILKLHVTIIEENTSYGKTFINDAMGKGYRICRNDYH